MKKYDYSDITYDGDIKKFMGELAESIESYADYIESYAIIIGMTEEEWNENMKTIKKLIKKLKKGDPSVFNIERLNEAITEGLV